MTEPSITTEFEPETGKWVAEHVGLPNIMVYGRTEREAMDACLHWMRTARIDRHASIVDVTMDECAKKTVP